MKPSNLVESSKLYLQRKLTYFYRQFVLKGCCFYYVWSMIPWKISVRNVVCFTDVHLFNDYHMNNYVTFQAICFTSFTFVFLVTLIVYFFLKSVLLVYNGMLFFRCMLIILNFNLCPQVKQFKHEKGCRLIPEILFYKVKTI